MKNLSCFLVPLFMAPGACSSAEKPAEVVAVVNTVEQVTIQRLSIDHLEWPLPKRSQYGRSINYSDGTKVVETGYYAWDLNGDGRPDVVHVLDDKGKVKSVAYDLNFDGKPDRYE